MGTLGRTTRNGKKAAASRLERSERSHPAIAKLAAVLKEHKETLEQQAATAEILRAISSSSTDPQPVFEAIVEHAHRLCSAVFSILYRYDGNVMTVVADRVNAKASRMLRTLYPAAPRRDHIVGRAILDAKVIHSADVPNDPRFPGNRNAFMKAMPFRAGLEVPLLRNGAAVGVIAVGRLEPKRFTKREISLLQTFADQALIAMENVRLFNETKEALEQQTATSEILRVISNSPTEIQPVLDAVAATAARLCEARDAIIQLREGDVLRFAAHYGTIPNLPQGGTRAISRHMVTGRAVLEGRQIHVHDLQAEEKEFPQGSAVAKEFGYRTLLVTPLMREEKAIGTIMIRRTEVRPFSDKHLALVRTFADQAVIAIENVRLFRELEVRNKALGETLEQQTATAEILGVISSALNDVQPVFDAIIRSAVRLCGGLLGTVLRFDGKVIDLIAHHNLNQAGLETYRRVYPMSVSRDTVAGCALLDRAVFNLPDSQDAKVPAHSRAMAKASGFRSVLVVPMLREGQPIGVINVARAQPGLFSEAHVDLLKTFADQAVIAIENARLFNETKEALERQTATSEVLRVISQSQTDAQPAFDAIIHSAVRLCAGTYGHMTRVDGDMLHLWAHHGNSPEALEMLATRYPAPLSETSLIALAVRTRSLVHSPDTLNDPRASHKTYTKALNLRAQVSVPLIRGDTVIGALNVQRDTPGPFSEEQLELLRTFADQAVIAIENARLFNETKEALERQTATAEILRVIAGTPADAQPVFDAIAQSALRVFDVSHVGITVLEGDSIRSKATAGSADPRGEFVIPLNRDSTAGRCMLDRTVINIGDTEAPDAPSFARDSGRVVGFRAIAAAPMLREGIAIGSVHMMRKSPGPFSGAQIELLKTFANQAVIAIENARLFNETKEALERQTATAEILKVISSSPTDTQPVFDAILERATKLCDAETGILFRYLDGAFHALAKRIHDPAFAELFKQPRRPAPGSQTGLGRLMRERHAVHIPDISKDEAYAERDPMRLETVAGGMRAWLGAPMLKDGDLVGAIVIYRTEPRPFSEQQVSLLKTFADQAVIAIENVRLFNELQTRNRALTEALEQQTATGDILKVISSSTSDVQPVFETIIRNAVRLCDGAFGMVFRYDGELMDVGAHYNLPPRVWEMFRRALPQPASADMPAAHAIVERAAINVPDIFQTGYSDDAKDRARAGGFRAVLAVPMMRENTPIGAVVVTRKDAGAFSDSYVALLKTFAAQAVIALENVRLFNEINEALRLQTSTADVLKTISRSTFDLDAVLQTLLDNATRLSGATRGIMLRPDLEGNYVPAFTSNHPTDSPLVQRMRAHPIRPGRGSINGRVLLEKKPIHVPDVLADPEYKRGDLAKAGGFRTVLSVPMLRYGEAIGLIALTKGAEIDPFTDKQMELVTTFADQAVIAIENVRLFKEIEEKSAQLEVANKHKSDFLANMSHELRTPLNAIIGFSEALMERMFGEVNDKQADYLKDIHESGRHLLSLINDILDLSKIEAGRMDLELASFHLPTALSNAMTLIRERAQRHGIELGLEVDQQLGEFQADERKFKQIMLNLLSNAVKFTPDGGRVDVSARKFDGQIEVAVRDTGIGIAPEDQAVVFEEFKQVGRDQMRKAEGTGLGLALTRRFVELHGGAIRLESTPGKGSTFTVSLPLRH